ncbi:MAG: fused MFS/spermidine synthase [Parcubacteria group bacterium]|nr:fused MFS/spermidine synthase [Parcubacteria group bacterium]
MIRFLKQHMLPISVFITGACVLMVEVVAVRILSPYYGNTIFTVSSVISVILAALSVGYYAGGKLADRRPSLGWFFGIILLSGFALLVLYFIGMVALPFLSLGLSLALGPLVSSLLLFFLPALLLGTLSPYAVRLQSDRVPEQGVGSVSGAIFFWSTTGSILGSLLAGFVLIPRFGIDYIMIGTGVVLFVLGSVPLLLLGIQKNRLFKFSFLVLLLLAATVSLLHQTQASAVYSKDGVYEKISIYDGVRGGRPVRFFQQDRSGSGAMFLDSGDPTDLVYGYTKYYSVYKLFKPEVNRALVIGGGAYSIPKALLAEIPDAIVDVAEIEPSLYELSKKYFGVKDDPRLRPFAEDGRSLLRSSKQKYDLIFSDVYYSLFSIPAQFTTQEFFTLAKEKLSEDGIFVANLIGDISRQKPSLFMSELKTFRSVFPNSYFFAVESPKQADSQNIIFVGYNSGKKPDFGSDAVLKNQNPILRSLKDHEIDVGRFELSPYAVLTDNFSPTDYLTSKVLGRNFNKKPDFDGDEMLAVIDQQLRYGPRYMSAPGHAETERFLRAEMETLADEVRIQAFDYVGTDGKIYPLANIVARFAPEKKRRIILATHYDSKRFADQDRVRKNEPVPGANDSASGVAVLVELARKFAAAPAMEAGVDIVFFDGEEGDEATGEDYSKWNPIGSAYFAEHLNDFYGKEKPVSGVVLDMVCDKDLRIYKERSSVREASAQTETFFMMAEKTSGGAFRGEIKEDIRDDHTPLNHAGIPSFLLIDFEYPYFHTTRDTLDKCSAESLATVARAVFDYVSLTR